MNHKKIKTFCYYLALFVFIIPLVSSLAASASRISDNKNNPKQIINIQDYYNAMNTCMDQLKGDTYSLSRFTEGNPWTTTGDYDGCTGDLQSCMAPHFGNRDLFYKIGPDDGPTLHSKNLAGQSGNYPGHNEDNEMFCYENNSAIFNDAMNAFGTNNDEQIKSLYCNGSSPGIFEIYTIDKDGGGINRDCNAALDLLNKYLDDGQADPKYHIVVNPSSNAKTYFQNWFLKNVGDLHDLSDDQSHAVVYARAAQQFMDFCAAENSSPSTESFQSQSEVQIHDVFSGVNNDPNKTLYWQLRGQNPSNLKFKDDVIGTEKTCQQVIDELNSISNASDYVDSVNSSGGSAGGTADGSTEGEDGTNPMDNCYNSGIDSMGWLLCPTINNASQTTDKLEEILKYWLQIDPDLIFKEGTERAWNVFRNIANIAMTIFLIAIILSQITGYGIDNYGIKKSLPRLIAVAILINFSYVLCQMAVDASNIVGAGICDLLQNIADTINQDGVYATTANIVTGLLAAIVGVGAIAGTAITIISVATGGGGVLLVLSLVLTLLVALVAVIMFFVMVAARMIIAIFFTVISPLAIACYVLPNTQRYFKKWFDVFKAALIVFPICGALYGCSYLVKAIILQPGDINFFWAVIGVALPFLPFFALPNLLRSALAGITAVGGAINAIGNGMRQGLTQGNQALQSTDRYKAQEARNRGRRAQRALDRIDKGTKIPFTNKYIGGIDKIGSKFKPGAERRRENAEFRREQYRQEADKYTSQRYTNAAATGSQPLSEDLAKQRADSAFDAQEYKNYYDQYSGLTYGELDKELNGYTDADGNHHAGLAAQLSANPNDKDAERRLRAALKAAEDKDMTDKIFDSLGSIELNRDNNAQLIDQLASSKNKVLSSYAKELAQNGGSKSLNKFVRDGGLQTALQEKGPDALVGMDDKTLKYIHNTNAQAVSGEMLMKAVTNSATGGKQRSALNDLIKAQGSMNYQLSAKDMANLDETTVQSLITSGNENVIKHTWMSLQADNDANRQILNSMKVETRNSLTQKFGSGTNTS